jgi:hypothetical protein
VEGPPARQVGEAGSSPEHLANGKGQKNRDGGGVLRQGGCSGGRRGPASGWEGRGGSSTAIPREKGSKGGVLRAPLTVEWVVTAEAVEVPVIGRLLAASSCTSGKKVVRGSRHGRQERRAVAYRGGVAAALDRPGRNGNAFKGVAHPSRSARGMPGGQCYLTGGPASASAPLTSGPA